VSAGQGSGGGLRIRRQIARGRRVTIVVDGERVEACEGETIAAALIASGRRQTRWTAKTGEPRGYFCGMGVCHDCLMTVDGTPNVRTCMTAVRDGLQAETQHGLGAWGIDR
jgi:aerobic-type carbon monoxide dehydrogenase small subunit (CoxS/CutS family)